MITCEKCKRIAKRNYHRIGLSSIIGNRRPHAWLCNNCRKLWGKAFNSYSSWGIRDSVEWDDCWRKFIDIYNPSKRSN